MARAERFEVPPERLARWLERWADGHGEIARTAVAADRVTFYAADGGVLVAEPPFPPLDAPPGETAGFAPDALLAHAARDRSVGVLLVRLGGHAVGRFEGRRLVDSKVGRRQVHARHRKGGSSQKRFARRRDEQARAALGAAAGLAAARLLPHAGDLDAVVLGGDRRALDAVLADARLAPLRPLVAARVLEVPEPRHAVLAATPDRFRATVLTPRGRASRG